jgi:hypothetical protein
MIARNALRFLLIVLMAVLFSCDLFKSSKSDSNLTGQWEGTWIDSLNNDSGIILMDIQETGDSLSGLSQTILPGRSSQSEGTLTGIRGSNESISFSAGYSQDTIVYIAILEGNTISGDYLFTSGSYRQGSGIFSLNRTTAFVKGCTYDRAVNHDPTAEWDDGTCILGGCMDVYSPNYDFMAHEDDGSCTYSGCTDPAYTSYYCTLNPLANPCSGANEYTIADVQSDPSACLTSP